MIPKTQRGYVGKACTAPVMIYRKGLDHAEGHFSYTVIQQNKQISLILSSVCPALSELGGGSLGFTFSLVVWGDAFAKREINRFI